MRISDWSSDVCSSDLDAELFVQATVGNQTVVLPETGRHGRQPGILERDQGRRLDPQQLAGVGRDLGSRCRLVVADVVDAPRIGPRNGSRSEEHTSELQSLMRISYAVFCLKTQNKCKYRQTTTNLH